MTEPYFSVIIPLYNKERYVLETVESVLAQTFGNFEIIIVDDGSTDNGTQLVKNIADQRIRLLEQQNQGVSVARNNGIEASGGKYIALLDADDIWLPNHLASLEKLTKKFPKAGLYCSRYAIKYHENYTKDIILSEPVSEGMSIIEDYFATNMLNPLVLTSGTSFKKTIFYELRAFDINIQSGQDTDLWIRFALNYPVAFNNSVTFTYLKDDENQLSKSKWIKDRAKIFEKYKEEHRHDSSFQKYLDLNRFALFLYFKMAQDEQNCKKLIQQIKVNNLTMKQKILLKLPSSALRLLAKTHQLLIRNKIYIKPFE